jgi:hypothetical protein
VTLVDVIIPTCPQYGGELMERCIAAYQQTDGVNVIVVEDSPNCGAGWIEGLERSAAPYVHLAADDIEPRNTTWLQACIDATERDELPAPVVFNPAGQLESCGGNMAMPGNLNRELLPDGTQVDFGGAPFMSRRQVDQIGMLPIQVCSDVWVHYRGRQLGYRSVVVREFELVHHRPSHADNTEDLKVMHKALEAALR